MGTSKLWGERRHSPASMGEPSLHRAADGSPATSPERQASSSASTPAPRGKNSRFTLAKVADGNPMRNTTPTLQRDDSERDIKVNKMLKMRKERSARKRRRQHPLLSYARALCLAACRATAALPPVHPVPLHGIAASARRLHIMPSGGARTASLPHCSTASPLQGAPKRAATATPDSPRPGWGRHPAGGVRRAALPAIAAPSGQVRYRGGQLRHTLGAGETLDTSETLATPLRPDDLKISLCRPGVEFARPCVHPLPRDQ